jgi:hypothetical protein
MGQQRPEQGPTVRNPATRPLFDVQAEPVIQQSVATTKHVVARARSLARRLLPAPSALPVWGDVVRRRSGGGECQRAGKRTRSGDEDQAARDGRSSLSAKQCLARSGHVLVPGRRGRGRPCLPQDGHDQPRTGVGRSARQLPFALQHDGPRPAHDGQRRARHQRQRLGHHLRDQPELRRLDELRRQQARPRDRSLRPGDRPADRVGAGPVARQRKRPLRPSTRTTARPRSHRPRPRGRSTAAWRSTARSSATSTSPTTPASSSRRT